MQSFWGKISANDGYILYASQVQLGVICQRPDRCGGRRQYSIKRIDHQAAKQLRVKVSTLGRHSFAVFANRFNVID